MNNHCVHLDEKVKPKPPPPPKPPLCRYLYEFDMGPFCPKCESSLVKRWFFWRRGGCINPECENYYGRRE